MTKILSVANQKGGVAKTTTVVNLAAALVQKGFSVLCIDFDPQNNMSDYLGYEQGTSDTISGLMQKAATMQQFDVSVCICHNKEGIDYIPSDIVLASADVFLATAMCREQVLKNVLACPEVQQYDFVIIDCLPSLGILLTNALAASDSVIIPVETQKFAMIGLKQLMDIIAIVRQALNPKLTVSGILPAKVDNTNMSTSVVEILRENHGDLVFETQISRRVEAANSTAAQQSLVSDKSSVLGKQYIQFAAELLERGNTLWQ